MSNACSGTQANDRFGITLDFVTKLHNGSITDEEAKRFLRHEDPFHPEISAKLTTLFSVVATTNLGVVGRKKTAKCFPVGTRYAYRDSDFDNLLPASQPKADKCVIATLAPAKDWTFAEVAATILGIGAGTDVALLGKALIENGYTMTLAQAEEMVEKTERGEKTGMRTDGYGHFFFVETGDRKNPVSVGYVYRDGRAWYAFVRSLGLGFRWYADFRLLVRNLKDTSKLGL